VVDVEFATDSREARRRRRRRPTTGRPALAAIGVALMIVATAGTASPEHATAGVQRAPRPSVPRPAIPPAILGADGGLVPTVAPPAMPQPPMVVAPAQPVGGGGGAVTVTYVGGIPAIVLAAYRDAAAQLARSQPGCHLPVPLLAAIGKVESGHARGGRVDANGTAVPPILGPVLNGAGFAAIPDTDHGALDGDPVWDRAVGPMQFIPSTWRRWAADGNHDGIADPENVYDAGLAAARYLCADGRDLSTAAGLQSAILSYNYSDTYLRLVSAWLVAYQGGIAEVAVVVTPSTPATGTPTTVPPPATGTPVTTTTVPPTPTTPNPPPVSIAPVPPTGPVTTTPVPVQPPAQSLVCDLQNTLGGLLGLLPPPPPQCQDSTPTTEPAAPTTR
jgi:membrane-bound lytic murein transglycosylase B